MQDSENSIEALQPPECILRLHHTCKRAGGAGTLTGALRRAGDSDATTARGGCCCGAACCCADGSGGCATSACCCCGDRAAGGGGGCARGGGGGGCARGGGGGAGSIGGGGGAVVTLGCIAQRRSCGSGGCGGALRRVAHSFCSDAVMSPTCDRMCCGTENRATC